PHEETLVSIATDKEAQYPVAYVFHKHPLKKTETVGDYRESIMHSLYNTMINSRLSELTQKADPPFILGQSSFSELFGPMSVYQSVAVCHNNRIEEGIKAVLVENERVLKYGFTESELERNKKALMNQIEKAYNEREKQKSVNYAEEYKRNFLMTEEPIPGIEKEYAYFKAFLPGITLKEINQLASEWITDKNRVVVVTAPEMEGVNVPSKEEVMSLLKEVEETEVKPYDDAVADIPLISEEPWPSEVVNEEEIEKVDAVEWTLQNGAKVVYKPTEFKEDEILFSAWSPGGTSLYDAEDAISADFAATIMSMSGIAGFDNITLQKILADEVFSLSPYVSELREGFSGNSTVRDLEVMLQMVYLYFTQPRFDEISFQSYMSRMKSVLQNKAASPEAVFQDTLAAVLADYHERAMPLSVELLQKAEFNRVREIGEERFKNAADFHFFFVGSVNPDTLKPMVEKYIGGIPSSDETEDWRDLGIDPPQGVVEKTVRKGQEEKSLQYIVFHGDFDYSSENVIELDAVGKILSTRLLEEIREERGGVYSIGASPSSSKYPEQEYKIFIQYGTDPEKLEELKQAVFDEIKDFTQNGPSAEELAKAKEKMLREREIALRENRFWLNILSNTYYLKDGDFSEYGKFNDLVMNLTAQSVQEAFKKYFDFNNYINVALKPGEQQQDGN
ncbi:MAG: insulinase family protein, partial [Mariniphaga sp.]